MTSDDIIPVLAKVLEDDASILAACHSNITPGYPATLQDSKLTPDTPTAIWLRDIDKTETGFFGSRRDGQYLYDILIQIDVMSISSQYEAESLRRLVENELKATRSKAYGTDIFSFGIALQSRPGTRFDDVLQAWTAPLRMRVTGAYVAQ